MAESFKFKKLAVEDLILVIPTIRGDDRGFFVETYKQSEFFRNGITDDFVQDNHSKSTKGVLRGLHYQKDPAAQGKLVRCAKGKIFDVGVDIRRGSLTFGKWAGAELSAENKHMLFIPKGFAHGFVVLSDEAEVLYKASGEYSPEHDRGILWCDPEIGIDWGGITPILSERDANQSLLRDADINFKFKQ